MTTEYSRWVYTFSVHWNLVLKSDSMKVYYFKNRHNQYGRVFMCPYFLYVFPFLTSNLINLHVFLIFISSFFNFKTCKFRTEFLFFWELKLWEPCYMGKFSMWESDHKRPEVSGSRESISLKRSFFSDALTWKVRTRRPSKYKPIHSCAGGSRCILRAVDLVKLPWRWSCHGDMSAHIVFSIASWNTIQNTVIAK